MLNIHTFIHSSIFFIILLPLSGCFEMEQTITLDDTGGMNFVLNYEIPDSQLPVFAQFHKTISHWQGEKPGQTWLFNKAAVARQFPKDTFDLTAYTSFKKDGVTHVHIAGKAQSASRGLASGAVGDFSLKTLTNGNHRLALAIPTLTRQSSLNPAQRQALLKGAAGVSITLTIQVPAPIKTTNGAKGKRHRVTWTFGPQQAADPSQIPQALFVTY